MVSSDQISVDGESRRLLRINPLDTLFFRDARPFDATSRAASGLPKPQTVAGALRTAMLHRSGVDLETVAQKVRAGWTFPDAAAAAGDIGAAIGSVRFRGPWFGRNGKILFRIPASLKKVRGDENAIVRLDPLNRDLPGWKPLEPGMKPLWVATRKRLETITGYLTTDGMTRFLDGGVPTKDEIVPARDLYSFEDRTGIAVDPARAAAAEGMIYAVRLLALRPGVCLHVEVAGPVDALNLFSTKGEVIALGGEGRRVAVTPEVNTLAMPSCDMDVATDRRLLVLTTPALVNGWRPDGVEFLTAAVSGHEAVSGWDLARGGPKPNRFAVPAGSVYFLRPGEKTAIQKPLTFGEEASLGWGCYLEGTWNHA